MAILYNVNRARREEVSDNEKLVESRKSKHY